MSSEGEERSSCIVTVCSETSGPYCPTCALHKQAALARRRFHATESASLCETPLFPSVAGEVLKKRMAVKITTKTVASRRGIPLKTAAGEKRFGGHFLSKAYWSHGYAGAAYPAR